MKEGRKMKAFHSKMWFKSKRGGSKVSTTLDFPDGTDMKGRKGKRNSPEGRQRKEGNGVEKIVETPIFIPYTKESKLRKKLQELDDTIGEATNSQQ